ncbi:MULTISPECIES: SGNH/GDSL hydrolase family protein [unclassified Paenibacillus]|uniref:SGNH/GDSL hydrolase family protein n=1 Tax=unclassified Paenibacillus TaxID=185978 RepID=UPI003119A21E
MKFKKTGMVWCLVILIFALGYLGIHREASSDSVEKEVANQPIVQSQQISKNTPQQQQTNAGEEDDIQKGEEVTVIGDSVIVGVEPYLKELLPKITVDGKVGRQMSQAKKVTDELKAKGALGDYVILELGTNGPFNKEQLRKVLTSLSDAKQVLVVTTRVPKGWQDTVNSTIKDVVPEFDNAKVVDWYAASEGEKNYFYKDGVHLKPDGSRYYASLLLQALQEQ